jgi:hypothetical protein
LAPQETSAIHPWLEFNEEIEVPTNTLKNACEQHQIKSIDLIHMDVQGAELMVLKGAEEFMQQIKLIWLEVEAIELYKGQPVKSDVEDFMSNNGFQILKDTVGRVSGDQLYINSAFYQSSMDRVGIIGKIRRLFCRTQSRSGISAGGSS